MFLPHGHNGGDRSRDLLFVFRRDGQSIWEKWAAFQGRCKAKFGKSNTGWNKAYRYRFHKESRWNELRGQ